MQHFHEWLDSKLAEKGWQAADLARAGIDPTHPRGIDPGLISRWRKPPPIGVVPTKATLDRLARIFGASRSETYVAAGLQPPADEVRLDDLPDPIEQLIRDRVGDMREAVRDTPRVFWASIINSTFDRAIGGARDMARLLSQAEIENDQAGTLRLLEDPDIAGPSEPVIPPPESTDPRLDSHQRFANAVLVSA